MIKDWLDEIESVLVYVIAKVVPWLAPGPTAFLVFRASQQHLKWPTWVAVLSAIIIEALGLTTSSTALIFWSYNRTKRVKDPKAPVALAIALVSLYFVTAELLTIILDIVPKLVARSAIAIADCAPAIFPFLSLAGTITIALRADHQHRVQGIADDRAEARRRRQENRRQERLAAQIAANIAQSQAEVEQAIGNLGETTMQILRIIAQDPRKTQADVAQAIGKTRQTVSHHLQRLEDEGIIQRNNGQISFPVGIPETWSGNGGSELAP